MFSNLLMGTLNKFKKEESKIQSVEQKQAEKQREVEKRLEDTKREEKEKVGIYDNLPQRHIQYTKVLAILSRHNFRKS